MKTNVIIGYDQTESSEKALAEAAREAAWRGASLTIVHAYHWMTAVGPNAMTTDQAERTRRKEAEEILEPAAEAVRYRYPGMKVEAHPVVGYAGHALAEAARGADLLVVGDRGRGGFAGLRLGSVAMRVLAGACCPVIVVRGKQQEQHDLIVAGVDIDEPCEEILEFAFAEASRRSAHLLITHVWDEPWVLDYERSVGASDSEASEIKEDRDLRLDSLVHSWQGKYPDVHAVRRVETGSAGHVLVSKAKRADLLVVGARRHGDGRHGMRVGPIANTVLHHAQCPVAVVPLG